MRGVFETMRVRDGRLPFLDRHMERLKAGAAALKLSLPPSDLSTRAAEFALKTPLDGVVRIEWDGVELRWDERELEVAHCIGLVRAQEPHPGYPFKSVDRGAFDRALDSARGQGADEPLFLTAGGLVAEGARFAVGWLDGDTVRMPDPSLGILPSIGARRVAAVVAAMGLVVEWGRYPLEALEGHPIFVVNAVRGVVPARWAETPQDERIQALARVFWPG